MLDPARIRESIRNRQLVREQSPMRGRELIGYLTLCTLIALPAVFLLWQQNEYVRTRFEIESLRKQKLALQERYRCLRIETGSLESLDHVEEQARKSGLVPRDETSPSFVLSGSARGPLSAKSEAAPDGGHDPEASVSLVASRGRQDRSLSAALERTPRSRNISSYPAEDSRYTPSPGPGSSREAHP